MKETGRVEGPSKSQRERFFSRVSSSSQSSGGSSPGGDGWSIPEPGGDREKAEGPRFRRSSSYRPPAPAFLLPRPLPLFPAPHSPRSEAQGAPFTVVFPRLGVDPTEAPALRRARGELPGAQRPPPRAPCGLSGACSPAGPGRAGGRGPRPPSARPRAAAAGEAAHVRASNKTSLGGGGRAPRGTGTRAPPSGLPASPPPLPSASTVPAHLPPTEPLSSRSRTIRLGFYFLPRHPRKPQVGFHVNLH